MGIVPLSDALAQAQAATLDLVEIVSDSDPIVCKIMDYGKHLFEIKKTKTAAKKKQKQQQIKEMKFRPGTEDGDYQVKLKALIRFLEGGDKAKVTLKFRGRELAHQELGMDMMQRIPTMNITAWHRDRSRTNHRGLLLCRWCCWPFRHC